MTTSDSTTTSSIPVRHLRRFYIGPSRASRRKAILVVAIGICVVAPCVADEQGANLEPLVQLLGQVEDADFQKDLLKGMREGLRGRRNVAMPKSWPAVYKTLSSSDDPAVREQARIIALLFGDPVVIDELRKLALSSDAELSSRNGALTALVERRTPQLVDDLYKLIDDTALRGLALRSLAAYSDQRTPKVILGRYSQFSSAQRQDAINTLSSRPTYALQLLGGVEQEIVQRSEISAFTARQLQGLGNESVQKKLREIWGEIRQTSADKKELIARYKKLLTPEFVDKANVHNGRAVYSKTCMKCHRLYGQGGQIGPDLTGSNRANLDYVLENVLDPNAVIGKDYQLTNAITTDARVLSGIIVERSENTITVQTVNERVVLDLDDIEELSAAEISMMPEGQFKELSDEQIRDLVAYLGSQEQVHLPANAEAPAP